MSERGPNRWFFDTWSRVYDWPPVQWATYRPVHNAVRTALGPLAGRRLLDVGCGTGQLTVRLRASDKDATVVGCDFSAGMLRQAAARSRAVPWVCGDACELPFRDRTFAAVVCTEAFHWFPDQNAALAEFFRILSPGGVVMIALVNPRLALTSELIQAASRLVGEPFYWPTAAQMRQDVEHAGFRVVEQRRLLRFPTVVFPAVLTRAIKPRHSRRAGRRLRSLRFAPPTTRDARAAPPRSHASTCRARRRGTRGGGFRRERFDAVWIAVMSFFWGSPR